MCVRIVRSIFWVTFWGYIRSSLANLQLFLHLPRLVRVFKRSYWRNSHLSHQTFDPAFTSSRYRWVERLLCRSKAWNRGYHRRCNWVVSSEHVKDFGRLLSPARAITAGPDTEINPDDSASNNVPSRASHLMGLQNLSLFQVKFGGELSRLFSISCKKKKANLRSYEAIQKEELAPQLMKKAL